MSQPADERVARRTYVRSRQIKVFTLVALVLAAALTISSLFFFHIFGLGIPATAAVQPNYGGVAPCAPKDSEGNNDAYLPNDKITIRVQNGTKFAGLAGAVGDALKNRQFVVNTVSNYASENVDRTTIYFGKNAIPEAYTVNGNFTDAKLVMDDRSDKLIDVVIGATFNDFTDLKNTPAAGSPIVNITGCLDAASMKNLPKAITHTKVG